MSFILSLISFKGTHLNETLSRTKIRSKNKVNLIGYSLQMVLASLLTILKNAKENNHKLRISKKNGKFWHTYL